MCNENAFTLHQSSRKILQEYSKKVQEPNEQRVVSISHLYWWEYNTYLV